MHNAPNVNLVGWVFVSTLIAKFVDTHFCRLQSWVAPPVRLVRFSPDYFY